MALKRQQAAEDAIALHLASAESGTTYEYLPPGRIFGMQVTSPTPDDEKQQQSSSNTEEISVSPASIEMLTKLFPNKKRSVLELVLKRCNHDLLKAIEHFNLNTPKSATSSESPIEGSKDNENNSSAFKPVASGKIGFSHQNPLPMISGSKVFMHSLYPFLPLFNPQPVLPSPVYVPGFCDCEQCKHSLYSRLESRP